MALPNNVQSKGVLPQTGGLNPQTGLPWGQHPGMTPAQQQQLLAQDQQRFLQQQGGMQPTKGKVPPQKILPGQQIPGQNPMAGPQTGLIGSEQALMGGLQGALGGLLGGYNMGRGDLMGMLQSGLGDMRSGIGALRNATGAGNQFFNMGANALQGAQGGLDALFNQGVGDGNQWFNQGVQPLQGFIPAGQNAQGLMANYTGANGADAQQQAYNSFVDSPGQAWLRERGERAVTRNAAATGGLGSGRVLQELQRQGQGLAAQDFQNHYNRLSGLSNQGLQAAGQVGSLRGQQGMMNANMRQAQAGLQGNMAQALAGLRGQQGQFQGQMGQNIAGMNQGMAGLRQQAGSQLGNMGMNTGSGIAGMMYGTGNNLAAGRMAVGNAIANRIGQTTDNLGNLQDQQGRGVSDLIGQGQTNIGNLLTGSGGINATSLMQLAQLLSGVNMQGSGQMAGLPGSPGVQQTDGWMDSLGNLASGVGMFMASDSRLKTNIRKIGETAKGTNIYSWKWNSEGRRIASGQPTVGVIAQEVPEASFVGPDGYLMVDYGRVE